MDQPNIDPQEEREPESLYSDEMPPEASKLDELQTKELPAEEPHEEDATLDPVPDPVAHSGSVARQGRSKFVARKRIWTIAIVCVLGVLLIAACIKAIEPTASQEQSLGSAQIAESKSPTATQPAAEVATATTAAAADVAPVETTTETVESVEPTAANAEAPTETVAGPAEVEANAAVQAVTATESYNGIPVGFTVDGHPFRGSPDAPVIVYEYSDFQCPFCSRYFVQTEPALNESFVRTNKLRVVFRDFPLVELHPNAPAAHYAAQCVAQQGAALFWAMHDALFRSQQEWSRLPDPLPVFKRITSEISSGESKVNGDAYDSCMAGQQTVAQVEADVQEIYGLGFSGTPSFRFYSAAGGQGYDLIGAQPYDQFASYVESIAAGQPPVDAQAQQQDSGGSNEIPFWASAEGLAPDPNRPGVNMAGDYYRGNINASVVVIEFSDYQCPYCGRHEADTQPTLDEKFVDTDQILWVFKNFPLSIHPQADEAAVAAECAADQGKFWEMHDLLFSDPATWSIDAPAPIFSSYAQQLGLDVAAFDACQQGPDAQQRVQSDMNDGSALVRGTPSFIILKDGQGRIIPGALPKEQFVSALDDVLANGFTQ